MTVLQTVSLAASTVKVRWQEPYVTSGLNEKSIASNPKGIVYGFRVVPTVGYSVQVQEDSTFGFSIANVNDTTGATPFSVSIFQPGSLFLDLTAHANTTVFIALDAQYTVGGASAAQLRVVDAAELVTNLDLVVVAKVAVPAFAPILPTHINMGYAQFSGFALPLPALPPFNMAFNSSFESDVNGGAAAGWSSTGSPTVTCSTDFARTGTRSLKINIAAPGVATVFSAPMPVLPGEEYNAGAWLRTDGGGITGTGLQLQAVFYDKANAPIGSPTDIEALVTGVVATFAQRLARVTAPALAAYARVQVSIDGATTGVGYVDDVLFGALHADTLAHSTVFGGSGVAADLYHTHTAAGLNYAGGPAWADGTPNPATTIEAQLDKILSDLAGAAGAPKVGNAPSKILNNVFVNTVPNTASIDATGKGTGAGVIGRPEAGSGANGVQGFSNGAGAGVRGEGGTNASAGTGFGVGGYFVGGTGAYGGDGVYATASVAGRNGVYAEGTGAGTTGVRGAGVGANSKGVWGTASGTEQGGYFVGGGTAPTNFATRASGAGVYTQGGVAQANGLVARGGGGSNIGAGAARLNVGVMGVGTVGGEGVVGVSAANNGSVGVLGEGSDGFATVGVTGYGKRAGSGVAGYGQDGVNGWVGGHGGYFEGGSGTTVAVGTGASGPAGAGAVGVGGDGWSDTDGTVMGDPNNGVFGQGGNGSGLGSLAGSGVWGQGGTGFDQAGQGVVGKGGLYPAIDSINQIGGYGGYFQGGGTYGSGLIALPFGGNATNNAFAAVMQGQVKLNDAALATSAAVPNVLGRQNHIAAWGYFQTVISAAGTVLAGWNISGETADGNLRKVTFASAMSHVTNYGVFCQSEIGSGFAVWPATTPNRTASYVDIVGFNTSSGAPFASGDWGGRLYSVLIVGANT